MHYYTPYVVAFTLGGTATIASGYVGSQFGNLPPLWSYLLAINVGTIFLYVYDKCAAKATSLRVPEIVLHLFMFAGGTPAAFASRQLLRHKTQKSAFRWAFSITLCLQVIIILLLWHYWF